MIVIPTWVLVVSTKEVYTKLNETVISSAALSDERKKARIKRNQSITRMLIGIIILFLVCHTGKVSSYIICRCILPGKLCFETWTALMTHRQGVLFDHASLQILP